MDVPRRIEQITGRTTQTARLDVTDRPALTTALQSFAPDAVLHFAGLKAVVLTSDIRIDPPEKDRLALFFGHASDEMIRRDQRRRAPEDRTLTGLIWVASRGHSSEKRMTTMIPNM